MYCEVKDNIINKNEFLFKNPILIMEKLKKNTICVY